MDNKFKPCPFCGCEETEVWSTESKFFPEWYCGCMNCSASVTGTVPWDNMTREERHKVCFEEAVKAWNKRV